MYSCFKILNLRIHQKKKMTIIITMTVHFYLTFYVIKIIAYIEKKNTNIFSTFFL
jgi:hypothetical protein